MFEMQFISEVLEVDEVIKITGCARRRDQVEWLTSNGWLFHKNRSGEPIVGRMYARLKMAGFDAATMAPASQWVPDFSKIR